MITKAKNVAKQELTTAYSQAGGRMVASAATHAAAGHEGEDRGALPAGHRPRGPRVPRQVSKKTETKKNRKADEK